MSLSRFALSLGAAAAASALLLGCTTSETPEPLADQPSSSAPEQPTPAPEPTTEPEVEPEVVAPADTVLPASCEEILTTSEATAIHEMFGPTDATNADVWLEQLLGPKAWAAISASDPRLDCAWAIPNSDGSASLAIGVIDDATKQDLIIALRDSVYTETSLPGADFVFEQGQSQEHRYTDELVFVGDVFITSAHTIAGDFARRALDSVIAANSPASPAAE